jgi:hypothetical protein
LDDRSPYALVELGCDAVLPVLVPPRCVGVGQFDAVPGVEQVVDGVFGAPVEALVVDGVDEVVLELVVVDAGGLRLPK